MALNLTDNELEFLWSLVNSSNTGFTGRSLNHILDHFSGMPYDVACQTLHGLLVREVIQPLNQDVEIDNQPLNVNPLKVEILAQEMGLEQVRRDAVLLAKQNYVDISGEQELAYLAAYHDVTEETFLAIDGNDLEENLRLLDLEEHH